MPGGGVNENWVDEPIPGVVAVRVESLDSKQSYPEEGGYYSVPSDEAKSVWIIDADGMQVVLLAQNGQIFVFDVDTRQFTATLEGPYERAAGAGFVVENGEDPFPVEGYEWRNYWYEEKDGQRITVLAGSELDGEERYGILMVIVTALEDEAVLSQDTYRMPGWFYDKTSTVDVFDAEGEQLKIRVTVDQLIIFDVSTREFTIP